MNVLTRDFRHGFVKLIVESADDLWYLSQIVRPNDVVKAKTTRRVKSKDGREGSDERRTFTLAVSVEKTDFQAESDSLRILGTIVEGPEDVVALGSHHSLGVQLEDVLSIQKEVWSEADRSILDDAVRSALRPKVLVVALDDGDAAFGMVGQSRVKYYDFSAQVGGKYDVSLREKHKQDFYKHVLEFITNLMQKESAAALILAGPGFEKDNFMAFLREKDGVLASKAAVENTGCGGQNGIMEVLKRPTLKGVLENLGAAEDVNLVNRLMEHIGRDDGLAAYGMPEVEKAVLIGAVDLLLVSDKTLASRRGMIEGLMRDVRVAKGRFHLVNEEGEAGRQLSALGGVAGILRFKLK
ncbi:MAG: mRNA surveillance protein pelota [Candidatus Altiarchaeota archaeon]|nr:mRNA surveillance protein pelota [Candidatus Altiarchaeota archaeon]